MIRHTVTYAPLVLPAIMLVVTQRAFARAKKIKYLAINEVIPFAEFAAAELRARRLALATVVLMVFGTIGLASIIAPPPPIRPKSGNPEEVGDISAAPEMTSRDPIPSRPNSAPASTADDGK